MIFVTIGTCEPFDRLLESLDAIDLDEEIVAQTGLSATKPRGIRCVDFLPYDNLVDLVRDARIVVTHAGVGSILTCLANGKRPVVVARSREHGDAVDDHQLELARRLEAEGMVHFVEDPSALPGLAHVNALASDHIRPGEALVRELRDYLDAHLI